MNIVFEFENDVEKLMNKFDIKIKIFEFEIFDDNVQYRLKFIVDFFNILTIIESQIISNN